MSGGSLDYICFRVEETAETLKGKNNPAYVRAFGEHLTKVAEALKDIEWVMSGDKSAGDEIPAINEVLNVSEKSIEILLVDAEQIIKELNTLILNNKKE